MKKAINILWDLDGKDEIEFNLLPPDEIKIPDGIEDEDEISDYLTDETGFCHKGFDLVDGCELSNNDRLNLSLRKFSDHYIPSSVKIRLIKNYESVFEGSIEDLYWHYKESGFLDDNVVAMVAASNDFLCITLKANH